MSTLFRELIVVPSVRSDFKLARIVKAAEEAELNLRGWPVLWLSSEYVKHQDECVTHVLDKRDDIAFGWRICRTGLLYHFQTGSESFYEGDPRSRTKNLFDPVLRILEFSEDLAVLSRLYQLLGLPASTQLTLKYSWTGAADRVIAYHSNPAAVSSAAFHKRIVPIDNPSCKVTIPVGVEMDEIPDYVLPLFRDLFDDITNDLGVIDDSVITEWARKCLTRSL